MPLATFPSITPMHPYGYSDERPVVVAAFAGGGNEQRAAVLSRRLRRYTLRFKCSLANRQAIDDFFLARGYMAESFLWQDLKDDARAGIALGTGDGSEDTFALPATGQYGGDYPVSPFQLYEAGSPVSGTVDTDARTFTFDTPPVGAAALTVDYEHKRRVRLAAHFDWEERVFGHFWTSIELREVPTE